MVALHVSAAKARGTLPKSLPGHRRPKKISDPAILPAISPLVLGVRGTMVDIGLGPTNGFSYVSENLLGDDHLVVSRQMSTIAPAC